MADRPTWLIGRNMSTVTITGVTAGTDGTLTDATGTGVQDIVTKFEEITFNSEPITEEISAASSDKAHTVILQEANSATVRCILQTARRTGESTNNQPDALSHLAATYSILKLTFARSGRTYTLYGCRGAYSETIAKGRSTATLTLLPLDPGQTNPTIT